MRAEENSHQTKPGAESGPRRAKARIYLGANLDEQPLTLR
jgi:hypothetical protein